MGCSLGSLLRCLDEHTSTRSAPDYHAAGITTDSRKQWVRMHGGYRDKANPSTHRSRRAHKHTTSAYQHCRARCGAKVGGKTTAGRPEKPLQHSLTEYRFDIWPWCHIVDAGCPICFQMAADRRVEVQGVHESLDQSAACYGIGFCDTTRVPSVPIEDHRHVASAPSRTILAGSSTVFRTASVSSTRIPGVADLDVTW